jgi:hypothetical protein
MRLGSKTKNSAGLIGLKHATHLFPIPFVHVLEHVTLRISTGATDARFPAYIGASTFTTRPSVCRTR